MAEHEREEAAIEALIEGGADTDPYRGPVQYMGSKLSFPSTADARKYTEGLVMKHRIRTRNISGANNMGESGHVTPVSFAWERAPVEPV